MQQKVSFIKVDIFFPGDMHERVIASLIDEPFEGFEEFSDKVVGYIPQDKFDVERLRKRLYELQGGGISFETTLLAAENWNSKWETYYEPISIGEFCHIRAPFHDSPQSQAFNYELLIQPQMSFGTGHHETTRSMIHLMQHINFEHKKVLDMGCGTGILGILAAKMGASNVLGIDIDPWSYENVFKNIELNDVHQMQVLQGDVSVIPLTLFDCILANINLNVLLQDIPKYIGYLDTDGYLLISGFYQSDEASIRDCLEQHCTAIIHRVTEANWLALAVSKSKAKQSKS